MGARRRLVVSSSSVSLRSMFERTTVVCLCGVCTKQVHEVWLVKKDGADVITSQVRSGVLIFDA